MKKPLRHRKKRHFLLPIAFGALESANERHLCFQQELRRAFRFLLELDFSMTSRNFDEQFSELAARRMNYPADGLDAYHALASLEASYELHGALAQISKLVRAEISLRFQLPRPTLLVFCVC